jgi:hypothetical protein
MATNGARRVPRGGTRRATYDQRCVSYDPEAWQRTIFEALRPADPRALFNLAMLELDLRETPGRRPEDFPADDLVAFMNGWLDGLDPEAGPHVAEWKGPGVRLKFQARGRGASWRGWKAMPSFNMLEPQIEDLHLTPGGRKRLIDLTLPEVEQFAAGELRVAGQGQSYQDTFRALAAEMNHFGCATVADLPLPAISVYAGMLGLFEPPPNLGNFDAGWRAIHREPPDD